MARCKSCSAEVVWAKTTAGKATPMERADDGTWIIVDGVVKQATSEDLDKPLYRSHFSSCPQAKQWRQR